ncbi:UDP-N-acetylmuramate dehydrogenase [Nitrosomonas ureae]|uniref:UDP-N-acetylenolpyruvoylglucosamine reductase n=1 Tax=Nitrosomonas ureae TaxID=44577 RepID=A0A285BYX1_9PROT|nr:UDP-N-acetylmuramate dehydrogenase [Nitrosomonas ureae]SNX60472.1 UDP-N-acetylmuramate dehydrogenase [Nitrosomonas ureae]
MIGLSENARINIPATDRAYVEMSRPLIYRGEMRVDEPMSRHISWRTGGNAQRYYLPADLGDFADCVREFSQEPIYVIGLGSNLLVRDGGIQGTVIVLHAQLNDLQLIEHNQSDGLIYAGAGVACAKVARFAARHDLAGAEFLAGIPGTIGGALAMNAGCYGSETWEFIERVQVVNQEGRIFMRTPAEYAIGYRSVKLHQSPNDNNLEWFAGGYIRLAQGQQAESRQRIQQLLAQRIASQPLNQPNAGSVFRNPPGDHAARLIEASGLKGCCMGGAMVSPQHANFIVNLGHATAADIEALILMVRNRVRKATGIELIQEVRIIGDARRLT